MTEVLLALIGVLVTLQSVTFAWVVRVESRLTRLETIIEVAFRREK